MEKSLRVHKCPLQTPRSYSRRCLLNIPILEWLELTGKFTIVYVGSEYKTVNIYMYVGTRYSRNVCLGLGLQLLLAIVT